MIRIEKCLKEKSITAERKTRLNKRLTELKEKEKKELVEKKEKIIAKRMETCLENLSPKQLRKLCLEYFNKIDAEEATISWPDICESVKIGDDYEFLTDFLSALYDLASFHGKKSFKVGTILVTSKQSVDIKEKGVVSIRDFVKKDSWRIPSSWDFDIPEDDLGEDWNRKDDSRLLIGASRFGKNLQKILASYPTMEAKAQDKLPSVRKRFGYLQNIYMNRGQPVEEFGDTLYSVDIEEDGLSWEEELEEEESDEEIVEIQNADNEEKNQNIDTSNGDNAEHTNQKGAD